MPRHARILSKTGIYHVMVRGNEKKNIFFDDADREKFLDILYENKKEGEYQLFAYCLMPNHFHLLIKEEKDPLARTMKRINTKYAYYFNQKYQRVGHVFQDRYRSEEIENESYLLEAARYIHNNPVKANMVDDPSHFRWSSFLCFIDSNNGSPGLVDTKSILDLFSLDAGRAVPLLLEYTNRDSKKTFTDIEPEHNQENREKTKEKARLFVLNFLHEKKNKGKTSRELFKDKEIRSELIGKLKEDYGLSIRQISEILGIDRNMVQRIK